MNAAALRYRECPDVVTLPARGGAASSTKPPVRIFLGSEDGQWRAERVFLFSIEQVRDPARQYEIHLMKNLAGFDRKRWRTGFTNYRFAVPELAGSEGRAIYNDVDQIYLDDPAKLFDLPLNGHGYLAVSAQDTSVMLVDCAEMKAVWNLQTARTGSKSQLLKKAAEEPGLWGGLAGQWNARDTEFPRSEIRLLHYTALHLQPWRPFPQDYSYHDHPLGDLWFDLERQADACGYQLFGCQRPSPGFPKPGARFPEAAAVEPEHLRDFILERGATSAAIVGGKPPGAAVRRLCPGVFLTWRTVACLPELDHGHDVVVALGLEQDVPGEDVPWVLDRLFASAGMGVFVAVRCVASCTEESVDVHRSLRTLEWWGEQMSNVAARYPGIDWRLDAATPTGTRSIVGESPKREPNVWILEGHRLGDALQLRRIADAIRWPYARLSMEYNPLHMLPGFLLGASVASVRNADVLAPPWPDLVIASGKRSSGIARWIKRQSGGRTRIVNVGRPWARLDAFDLIVTTPQYQLPARPNTLHLSLPITSRRMTELTSEEVSKRYANLPRPRIAVLVGGNSTSCRLDTRTAASLGGTANELARERGGSLLISGSPRTPADAFRALLDAVTVPNQAWEFGRTEGDNPYLEFLAAADEIIVTGDSVSMLADALATGRAVRVFPLPQSLLARIVNVLNAPVAWWTGHRRTYRGTPKQQGRVARWYDHLVDRGIVTPPRDLDHLHEVLRLRGLVNGDGSRKDQARLADDELCLVVERIRRLLDRGGMEVASE
jgi:mitochondrial fission protein ELM1